MQRCYCGSMSSAAVQHQQNCLPLQQQQHLRQTHPRGDLMSVTSSSRQSLRPTQFVKRPSLKSAPTYGLGHSNTGLGNDFSRRNSAATTVSHCSSCSCSSAQQRQQSRAKVLRWGWEKTGGVDTSNKGFITGSTRNNNNYDKYTENRRIYEQSACVASRQMSQGQGQVHSSSSASSPRPGPSPINKHSTDELQQLRALQQFRLSNVSDCFSDGRQDELRLQQAYDKLSGHKMDKWNKNRANESRQQEMNDTTTPYALRQKLLQLRLQEEQKSGRGTGAVCAPLEKSCALRYN
ncbi:uncharacterized protein Dana_GF20709 [Drosophila ananassae]|uniref:Uncharacterized protein n=1 Tax=Drosophila ananassae TaxID=7217 RepID=B3N1R4_DROAN|nr:uncharacterized protein LOC6503402 [Drosophila ananassae]EDV34033.1 uncharacterized protein Dana_GF20709 [Drosophila ananassae]